MRKIILLVLICLMLVFTIPQGGINSGKSPQREEIAIVVVKAPEKRHPFQTEYEEMLYPTVRITAGFSTGSGVVISLEHRAKSIEDSDSKPYALRSTLYILTAAHVVEDQSVVDIELYDSTIITGTVVITDTTKDLALLCVSAVKPYFARLAPRDYTPYLFTPVYTIGCSLGLSPRPSAGMITAINKDNWEVSSPILPGNSGGPVYDARTFEVIGIAVWVRVYNGQLVTTMAGVVPIDEIYKFIDEYERTKELKNERTN